MLAVHKSDKHHGKCLPNILPCRVNHNGQADVSKRYWAPNESGDGKKIAHFRGRQLQGRQVKIPEGYKGVVLSCSTNSSEANDKCSGHRARKDEDDEDVIEESIMEEKADFADIMVWGHEASPDEATDPYLRGIQEWIAFAEVMHSIPSDAEKK